MSESAEGRVPRNPPFDAPDAPIRLAVCASGGGTTLQNLIDRIVEGRLAATIGLVVASRAGIGAIARAQAAGIPVAVEPRSGRDVAARSAVIFDHIRAARADLVVLGGFLSLLAIPTDYAGRVINIHPSLIPAFSGPGWHGEHVHQGAIDRGVKVSGCTVHFVDEVYDNGPIILQTPVPVRNDDDAVTLAARVFAAECEALPEAIALYAQGKLRLDGGRVRILP